MSTIELHLLGENLKRLRQIKGLSQERLAELAGLHRTYVGGVERGERNISLLNLVRLSRVLEVSITELVEGIE
jgi:transcriptional regulator with XRE-family HTH domain